MNTYKRNISAIAFAGLMLGSLAVHAEPILTDAVLGDSNTVSAIHGLQVTSVIETYAENTVTNLFPGVDGLVNNESGAFFDKTVNKNDENGMWRFTFNVTNDSGVDWTGYMLEIYNGDFTTRQESNVISFFNLVAPSGGGFLTDFAGSGALVYKFDSPLATGNIVTGVLDLDFNSLPDIFGIRQVALQGDLSVLPVAAPEAPLSALMLLGMTLMVNRVRRRKPSI